MRSLVEAFNFGAVPRLPNGRAPFVVACFQIMNDRTFRAVVAVTARRKMLERAAHLVKRARLALELSGLGRRQRLDVGAGPAAIIPQCEQPADLVYAEAKIARATDKPKGVKVPLVIIAIAGLAPPGGRDQANFLIVANHSLADAARLRDLANLHNRTPRSRSELPITETELIAIAAPAIIGLSSNPNQG